MNKRPLSPHLSIYKPQMSSTLSIMHRITGAFLFASISFLSWYFIIDVFYGINCECFAKIVNLCWLFSSFAFFYHLCTGIRHLIWDSGWLLEKEMVSVTGYAVLMTSAFLSICYWCL